MAVPEAAGRSPSRRRALAALLAPLLLVAAACDGSGSGSQAAPTRSTATSTSRPAVDGALALGQLAPVTGPVSQIASAFTTPVRMAVDEMNLAGGINGKPVTLTVTDDASAVPTARTAFAALTDTDHVDAVVGPSSSELAAVLMRDLPDEHVVMCSGSNTAGALSDIDSGGYYFRTAPPDRLQALAMAKLVTSAGHRTPVVLTSDDTYGTAFGDRIAAALRAAGAEPTVVRHRPDSDPTATVARALRGTPDAAIVVGFPDDAAPLLAALAAAGRAPAQFPTYGTDGLQSADLGPLVDPANPAIVAGLTGTTPAGFPAGIDHPLTARMLAAGVEPFFSGSAYDCTLLIGLAAIAAKSDDADAIRSHFAANLRGSTSCTGFVECANALRAGEKIHYRGAFSAYDRWRGAEPGTGVYDVWTMGLDAHPTLGPATSQITVG
jgi:branched-chain amino acid transport system substrate-binding protein